MAMTYTAHADACGKVNEGIAVNICNAYAPGLPDYYLGKQGYGLQPRRHVRALLLEEFGGTGAWYSVSVFYIRIQVTAPKRNNI